MAALGKALAGYRPHTETQGFEYDHMRENAWHYRDYIIKVSTKTNRDRFGGNRSPVMADPITTDGIIATSL
jgi:hypothetical protein